MTAKMNQKIYKFRLKNRVELSVNFCESDAFQNRNFSRIV